MQPRHSLRTRPAVHKKRKSLLWPWLFGMERQIDQNGFWWHCLKINMTTLIPGTQSPAISTNVTTYQAGGNRQVEYWAGNLDGWCPRDSPWNTGFPVVPTPLSLAKWEDLYSSLLPEHRAWTRSPGEPPPATSERVRDDGRMEGSLAWGIFSILLALRRTGGPKSVCVGRGWRQEGGWIWKYNVLKRKSEPQKGGGISYKVAFPKFPTEISLMWEETACAWMRRDRYWPRATLNSHEAHPEPCFFSFFNCMMILYSIV